MGEKRVEIRAPWSLLCGNKVKTAFSIQELVGLTSEFSIRHAPNCSSSVIRTDTSKHLLVYKVTCRESYSDSDGHTVRMKFDFNRLKKSGSVNDLDVRVSCSCPAFLWYGAQWNLSTGDALYGAPRPKLQAPTDPKRYRNVVCKHVKVVADRISPVLERMLGVHLTKQDEDAQKEQQKQIDLVNERTQHEVEKAEKKERPPITPLVPMEEGEMEAMPEKQFLPDKVRDVLKLPPISPKKPQEGPEEEMEAAPLPPQKPVPPPEEKKPQPPVKEEPTPEDQGPKARRMKRPAPNITLVDEEEEDVGSKAKRMKLPPNITLVDEDEEEPITILPGAKAKRMLKEESRGIPEKKDVRSIGPKARRMMAPKAPLKPKNLPPNLKLIDDDSDDDIVKINRLKMALLLAGEA